MDGPATALMCSGGEGLAGVVVVVGLATVFDEGGFVERFLIQFGIDGNG